MDNKKIFSYIRKFFSYVRDWSFFNHEFIIVKDCKAQILLETVKNCAK